MDRCIIFWFVSSLCIAIRLDWGLGYSLSLVTTTIATKNEIPKMALATLYKLLSA